MALPKFLGISSSRKAKQAKNDLSGSSPPTYSHCLPSKGSTATKYQPNSEVRIIPVNVVRSYPRASLLGLPREIRNKIYDYAITPGVFKRVLSPAFNGVNLHLTCRQIYYETNHLSWTNSISQLQFLPIFGMWATKGQEAPATTAKAVALHGRLPEKFLPGHPIDLGMMLHLQQPDEVLIRYCTCELKNMRATTYLPLVAQMRDKVTVLLDAWPAIKGVTFFLCGEGDPLPAANFPHKISRSGKMKPDWHFAPTFRAAFEPDARYFGPWSPEPTLDERGTVVGWRLRVVEKSGAVRTHRLDFFNVAEVYGAKCVFDVGKEV